jgi:ribosome-associated toxin RatA of RatAB toxin-antitoxin module
VRSVHRSVRVPYSAAQMFELVNDVEAYPRFLHWCRAARVERRGENTLDATLEIGIGGIRKSFTTRNRIERPSRISVRLVSGPFRHMEGDWRFRDRAEGGCEVELSLAFEVASAPLSLIFAPLFEEAVRAQMNAFISRARRLYG